MSTKVLITSRFNDKILGYHFLVHDGCVIMMFYIPEEPKSGNPKFIIESTVYFDFYVCKLLKSPDGASYIKKKLIYKIL